MKKIIGMALASFLLMGCSSDDSTLSFSKIETIPESLTSLIDTSETLQLIYEGDNIAYLVYQTEGEVTTGVEDQEEVLHIRLDASNEEIGETQEHVYKMTLDDHHEVIEVYINGEFTAFDSILTLIDESGT